MEKAKKEVINGCLNYANKQLKVLKKYPEIVWLKHRSRDKIKTVKEIISILS